MYIKCRNECYVLHNEKMSLRFVRDTKYAFRPSRGSEKAAGVDLKSAHDYLVPRKGRCLISTDLRIELPPGCYGRVAPRSGLALKEFLTVGGGVIDEDYRGVLSVILFNHSNEDYFVRRGDKIAQLVCEKILYPEIVEATELTQTKRGDNGLGSTGV
ncbi:dUTPase [Diatraea saccharalis granulovirus]|uniref:dUTP diphosphatase n=1 Tax=Diatraea saccharalis granulovirus TaxID=1675862 RepID=A0A0R7EZ17_9BBAC|nr:dUTPase [Diatraea saccharalis granulovirus]AKN80739.1 dUTPase [Diatraea saccharalis granulovirus]